MKFNWLASLRARLTALVVVCTLPALALVAYTAVENYRIQTGYAYGVSWLAINGVINRYNSLVTNGRNLLPMMAELPAIHASVKDCNQALTALVKQVPLFEDLDVVSLNGDLRCSSQPFTGTVNMADRGWYREVLTTRKFAVEVVSKGTISSHALLVLSAPYFDQHGDLAGMLNAVIPAATLQPSPDNMLLAHATELVAFSRDGTVLMRSPPAGALLNSDQSKSDLFKRLAAGTKPANQTMAGIDGVQRLYALQHFTTGKPGNVVYLAAGVDVSFLRHYVLLPLLRNLAIIVLIAVFILVCVWWFTSALIKGRVQPLLRTLQRIGSGELQVRTGLAASPGEFGEIARGVERMAGQLQARVAAQQAAEYARDSSERRYAEFLEQANDGILIRLASGEILYVNNAFCRMLGYDRNELLRVNAREFLDKSDPDPQLISLHAGETRFTQGRLRHKSGRVVVVEVSAVCLVNEEVQIIARDISERLEVQSRLERSERQYRELVEQSILGILVLRPADEINFANEALCRLSGYRRDELLRMPFTELADPSEISMLQRLQRISVGETLSGECRIRHKNGDLIYVELNARRLENKSIQITFSDISARVLAERRYAEERNFALNALNTLPGIFFVLDNQGRFLRWNRHFEDVTGYRMEELQLRGLSEITPPELRERFSAVFRRALTGVRMEGEFEIHCYDGTRVPYYCVTDRLQTQGQLCVVVVGVDISERKQAEQRVNMYLEELQQLSARLLAIQEEERRGIARELHDEFGQGLTAALLHLKELTAQAGAGTFAGQVQQVATILTQLTQQMRTLSLNLRPSVLDDLGLAAAVRWYMRERVEPAGLHVTLDMDKSLPRLSTRIETTCFRVLQGVLTNVLRHAHAKQVQVSLHLADGVLTLTVHDDGCGFVVQQARRDAVSGKSLGLLGMEERVRLAGGKFSISSSSRRGTEVRVTLPVA